MTNQGPAFSESQKPLSLKDLHPSEDDNLESVQGAKLDVGLTLNELVLEAHKTASEKGWWRGRERPPLEMHMLMVSEIAEATEEARKGTDPLYFVGVAGNILSDNTVVDLEKFTTLIYDPILHRTVETKIKPEG